MSTKASSLRLRVITPVDEEREALDALVDHGPLTVAFQPIVDLTLGEPVGYEVLGRCGPVGGPLAGASGPAELLDIAHRHGRLLALDRRWREIAVAEIARHSKDDRGLFFLNVDPRVADDPAFVSGFTLALVEQHGLPPERFVLELTEAACQNPAVIEKALNHYARQGFRVALDDLGAGQQSLTTLLRLQPHIVKLDRDLVRGVDVDPARAHLLDALAQFARRTGTVLVAEGIETVAQLRAVCNAGVTCAQGYLLGRPAARPEPLSPEARAALTVSRRLSTPRLAAPDRAVDPSALLLEVVEKLGTAGPIEAMLQLVADCAAGLLSVERVSLRLLDESRSRVLVAARTGASLHRDVDPDVAVGEHLASWIASHRAPLRVDYADADPRLSPLRGATSRMGSFVGAPLLDAEGCIGVIGTTSPLPRAFSAVHERWLRVLAGVAAPYLDVARRKRLALASAPGVAAPSSAAPSTTDRRHREDRDAPLLREAPTLPRPKALQPALAAHEDSIPHLSAATATG